MIASLARSRFKRIQLLDVIKYLPRGLNLPFEIYQEGQALPIKDQFDTVLLLTVLHHSRNPDALLQLAWEATASRLIIIESVVDPGPTTPPVDYSLIQSPREDQVAFAAFVDWFYNRVLHDDVPVPYNFTTPAAWESVFLRNKMNCTKTVHYGQDISIGPEYHVMFILEKQGLVKTDHKRVRVFPEG
jgi:hypothetical protein